MNKNWVLSQEAFDALLDWLDPDREQAGIKYEQIRLRLIKIFTGRGCSDAEDLRRRNNQPRYHQARGDRKGIQW
jgi:hypothetical protein